MRFDPFSLPRPKPVQETKTFTDPLQPGAELPLTFCARVDAVWETGLSVLINELVRLYVNGTTDEKGEHIPPTPILGPDGARLEINEITVSIIAQNIKMQVPADGEPPFEIREWLGVGLSMPNAFFEISKWADELRGRARAALPLESAADTGTSLPLPSDSTIHTPNSAPETMPS